MFIIIKRIEKWHTAKGDFRREFKRNRRSPCKYLRMRTWATQESVEIKQMSQI